jgi:glycine cleavage system H lipoate-binding protein
VNAHLALLLAGCRLYLDRPYRPPHFWLDSSVPDRVTVGLDGALIRMLRPIRRVVSPGEGLHLDRDQPCGWIARDHFAVPLRMPVAGEVIETNSTFGAAEEPCRLPEGKDWLFTVRPSESLDEVPGVVGAEETLAWYAERMRTVKEAILSAVQGPEAAAVGAAMADGGTPEATLEGVLGRDAFEALIYRITAEENSGRRLRSSR